MFKEQSNQVLIGIWARFPSLARQSSSTGRHSDILRNLVATTTNTGNVRSPGGFDSSASRQRIILNFYNFLNIYIKLI